MRINIHPSSDLPIYEQIASEIKRAILAGEVARGAPLPSMRTLAKDLRVSVITTKRAYEELERQGFIESAVGRGSFVKSGEAQAQAARMEYQRAVTAGLQSAAHAARLGGIDLAQLQEELTAIYEGEEHS